MSERATQQGQGSGQSGGIMGPKPEFMGPMDLLSDRRVGVRLIAMGPELRRYSFLCG
jgi:hypothetical protein